MALFDLYKEKIQIGDDTLNLDKVITALQNERIGDGKSFLYLMNQINKTSDKKSKEDALKNALKTLYGSGDVNQFKNMIGDRSARYKEYQSIIKKISYAKRAVSVVVSEILSPNILNNDVITYKLDDDFADINRYNKVKNRLKRIFKETKLMEKHLKMIVNNVCVYGDAFLEIIDMDEELKKKHIMQESIPFQIEEDSTYKFNVEIYSDNDVESSLVIENDDQKKNHVKLENILLVRHNPGIVVRLGEEVCFGYLVFPSELANAPQINENKLYNVTNANGNSLDQFIVNFKAKLQNYIKSKKDLKLTSELKALITKLFLFYNSGLGSDNGNTASIRYVKPEAMIHFKFESNDLHPYGESLLYGSEFDAKLLLLFKTAITIMRLTHATEKRIIALEIDIDNDVRKGINKIKEKYENRRFSIDNGGIDAVPSMVTSFENIYVPMKQGKRFIEFDTLPNAGDPGTSVEDYKAIRDGMIANWIVPPAYLALEENLESRATLSHENIIFAKAIIDKQVDLEKGLNEFARTVYNLIFGETYDNIKIQLSRPKSIQLESEKEYYSSISELLDIIDKLGLNKQVFMKKYIDPELMSNEYDDMSNEVEKNPNAQQGGGVF